MDAYLHADLVAGAVAAGQHGIVSRDQLERLGLSEAQIGYRTWVGTLERVARGAYRPAGAAPTWRSEIAAALRSARCFAAASHRCAAALWGLEGFPPGIVEVTCERWRRSRGTRAIVHESALLERNDFVFVDGLWITTPPRTIVDLPAIAGPRRLERALDDAIRKDLADVASIRGLLARPGFGRRRGAALLRELLDQREGKHIDGGKLEKEFFELCSSYRLPVPARQHPVDLGHKTVYLDFSYPDILLCIEVDGFRWHGGRDAWEADADDRAALVALGWTILPATSKAIRRGSRTLAERLRRCLTRMGHPATRVSP